MDVCGELWTFLSGVRVFEGFNFLVYLRLAVSMLFS